MFAMQQAKSKSGNRIEFFNTGANAAVLERVALERELHQAYALGQFQLVYQPQIALATGAVVGLEAMLRWRHPGRGLLSPALFLHAAEASGLMGQIGDWVLMQACVQARIRGLESDAEDRAIVRGIIALGHSLQLNVMAEGVETNQQVAFLAQAGCDELQGCYASRPLAADQLDHFLRQQQDRTAPKAS